MAKVRGPAGTVACLLMLAQTGLIAQGAVSGQVAILEKPGEHTADLANSVVSLELPASAKPKLKKTTAIINMHGREFLPHVTVVTVGSTVQFQDQDPFQHNAFSNSPAGSFDFGLSDRGSTVEQVLRRAGTYPVFCNIHARMSAVVIVLATPYYAMAESDGHFTLAGIPAGAYTLHVWNERGGDVVRPLTVPALGVSDVTVELDARGFQKAAHKNKFGQDYTSAGGERY